MHESSLHRISIVIPVYQGEKTLPVLLGEILPFTEESMTMGRERFIVSEVVLVHDCGPDDSGKTIATLAQQHPFVKPVWLSKNFGQHPATLAGMASSTGDWVVTMDEDGQQDPADISRLLDCAVSEGAQLVYAKPANPPPHGAIRNSLSLLAKNISTWLLGNREIGHFNSFRLVRGEIARSLAAYCGNGVFLDVALFWMTARVSRFPVMLRSEDRPSGYSFSKLFGHFWQLLLTSGTRPLRLITFMGFGALILAVFITVYALFVKFYLAVPVQGWASIVIVVSFFSGCILMCLGVIAEYMAVTMSIVMGKPLYVVSTRPTPPRKQ
jgi:undecaprenyl-phosphate 4-deoxy-4-formamido-L-arabinose transferase